MTRAAALVLVLAAAACTDDGHHTAARVPQPMHAERAADPAQGMTTELDGIVPTLGTGLIAEATGDATHARAAYERLLATPEAPPDVAARAALHLATLEARAGADLRARDLIARATALSPNDTTVTEGADRVRADIVAAAGAGDIRGPKLGTPLPGVTGKLAAAYAAAEKALARVHAMRPRERLAVWEKEDATAAVVRQYRAIAEAGGVAQVVAEYRIGTLYHDLALGLMFEPVGAELRSTLFTGARKYLEKAAASYRASLAAKAPPEAETLEQFKVWRLAAETGLQAALDVLGETDR